MNKSEQAVSYHASGFSCAQAVCTVFAEQFGLEREAALKVAAGFGGGGMGRISGVCGAVSGAIMALGLIHGAHEAENKKKKDQMYVYTQEFVERFAARYGSILGGELLECDVSNPAELERAKAEHRFDRCPSFVKGAVELLEEMLEKQEHAADLSV